MNLYCITIYDVTAGAFVSTPFQVFTTDKEQVSEWKDNFDSKDIQNPITIYLGELIRKGKCTSEYFNGIPFATEIEKVYEVKTIAGGAAKYTYINNFGVDTEFSFSNYFLDFLYIKNNGEFIRACKIALENCIFYNKYTKEYSNLKVLPLDGVIATKGNNIYSIVYLYEKSFESEEELKKDIDNPSEINFKNFFKFSVGD